MFDRIILAIRRWLRLRTQRAYTLALFRSRWPQLQLRRSGCRCGYCLEDTQAILEVKYKLSPAGESFAYTGDCLGGVCLRCQCVGRHSDSSGNAVHVDNWVIDHKQRSEELERDHD